MRIRHLQLFNFRSAATVSFEFNRRLNLLVGINGSGKSTVLDALSICLSWLVKRIERDNGRGSYIPDSSLRNEEDYSSLTVSVGEDSDYYEWMLAKTEKGKTAGLSAQLAALNELAEHFRHRYDEDGTLPVIAYYPVNRVVGAVNPEVSVRETTSSFEVYENALGGKANYQSFFEWFRIQDDILNEKAQSRSMWMKQNRNWLKRRVSRLLESFRRSLLDQNEYPMAKDFERIFKDLEKNEFIYDEPRFLFNELAHLLEMRGMRWLDQPRYLKIINDLEYMFHKMDVLSKDFRDDLIEDGGGHEEIVFRIIRSFDHFRYEHESEYSINELMVETFVFATLLSLWWLSDAGKINIERQLRLLLRPTVALTTNPDKLPVYIRRIINKEIHAKKNATRRQGRELQTVTEAIEQFLPEYQHLRVTRMPRPHMLIDKNGQSLNLDQLSDGEKNLIALVGDIARRLAIANPGMSNPLEGEGIILIDEIDLHLHPRWQRLVIPKLLSVFKRCQFFISTHSPLVISHVKPRNVFLLTQDGGTMTCSRVDESYGMSIERIVELIMDDESRPTKVRQKLELLFEHIERNKLEDAKKIIAELKRDMPSDPDLMRAEVLLRREERRG
jgi:predicted ATP-binding protein involved in virulence